MGQVSPDKIGGFVPMTALTIAFVMVWLYRLYHRGYNLRNGARHQHTVASAPQDLAEIFGFCYRRLFRLDRMDPVQLRLGKLPLLEDILDTPTGERARVYYTIEVATGVPSTIHITENTGTQRTWTLLQKFNATHPGWRVGAKAKDPKAKKGKATVKSSLLSGKVSATKSWLRRWWLFVAFGLFLSKIFYESSTFRWFLGAIAALILLSNVCRPLISGGGVFFMTSLFVGSVSLPIEIAARCSFLFFEGKWSDICLYLLSFVLDIVRFSIGIFKTGSQIKHTLDVCRNGIILAMGAILEFFASMSNQREQQAGETDIEKWMKTGLLAIAHVIRVIVLWVRNKTSKRKLTKLADAVQWLANASNFRTALGGLADVLADGEPSLKESPAPTDYTGFDTVDFEPGEVPEAPPVARESDLASEEDNHPPRNWTLPEGRTLQSADMFPPNHCKHLVTKGNIMNIRDSISKCARGSVHIITAATGTGKSTVIPFELSQATNKIFAVGIPLIAAVRSSAEVIYKRFGSTPHTHAESKHTEGDCNIHLHTSKSLAAKMMFVPNKILELGGILFDEMHVDCEENDLFRRLSAKLATKMEVLWASATFAQSLTLPGDLQYPVVERIHKSVTLENVFTWKCKVRGVTPDTIRGRYLIFCASIKDLRRLASRFKGSSIPVYQIHSQSSQATKAAMKADLNDVTKQTVIVIATNCMETGVTEPFNYVVDFREHITPAMTYDPPSLTTKRAKVTKGMYTQRKGRIGRLFKGIYIAPPVEFSPASKINDSGLAMASIYGRLFGYDVPQWQGCETLDNKELTDCFLKNVIATRMNPIAVAGMTTPEGRIFQSFKQFEWPKDANTKEMVFTEEYFPLSLYRQWKRFPTSHWEQWDENRGIMLTGDSVGAPFWDYTTDDKVQIDNWQKKVFCAGGDPNITDPQYNDPKFMTFKIRDDIRKSWLYLGQRRKQGRTDNDRDTSDAECRPVQLPADSQVPAVQLDREADDDDNESVLSEIEDVEFNEEAPEFLPDDDEEDQTEPPKTDDQNNQSRRPPSAADAKSARVWGSIPLYVICRTLEEAPWIILIVYFVVIVIIWLLVLLKRYVTSRMRKQAPSRQPLPVPVPMPDTRVPEREVIVQRIGDTSRRKRPFEARRRKHMMYEEGLELDDFVVLDFHDSRGQRRVQLRDVDDELDRFYDDHGRGVETWDDDVVTMHYEDMNGTHKYHDYYEGLPPKPRRSEVALNVKKPIHSLKAIQSSQVALTTEDGTSSLGHGVIVKGIFFANGHVLDACGPKVKMVSARGSYTFKPHRVDEAGDLVVCMLPPGVPGTSHNLQIREPVPGEEVNLIAYNFLDARNEPPNPSEKSFIAPGDDGTWGYSISTQNGDCGTAVIATSDGALVGIHGEGGTKLEQANFCWPITRRIVDELNRRQPQRAVAESIYMPHIPDSFDLGGTCRVAPEEQAKRGIYPIGKTVNNPLGKISTGSFNHLAYMKKHVSKRSKITIDPFAWDHLKQDGYLRFDTLTDYLPSAMTDEAYWKDIAKYDRPGHVLPEGFFEIADRCVEVICPQLWEPVRAIDPDEAWYRIDKNKSSGPRLQGKKGQYIAGLDKNEFRLLMNSCERLYDVPSEDFVGPVWQVAIKDEIRPREKVVEAKTRTFMSSPIESILGNIRIMADFNDRIVDTHRDSPWALGINKFDGGWNDLADYFGHDDMLYTSGDGSRYDSSVNCPLITYNYRTRRRGLPPKYHRHLRNYYSEVAFTNLVLADGTVTRKSTGNPSGQLNTTPDNCISLMVVAFWSLVQLLGEEEFLALYQDKKIRIKVYGDDFAMSIHKSLRDRIDLIRLSQLFADCGLSYDFTPYTENIEELRFLSHQFAKKSKDGKPYYLPRLDPERIIASCLYRKKTDAIATHGRYLAAFIHAFVHKNVFKTVARIHLSFYRKALADRDWVSSKYRSQFPLFDLDRLVRLYYGANVGFASKTYPHKRTPGYKPREGRTLQMASLEKDVNDDARSTFEGTEAPLTEANQDMDLGHTNNLGLAPVKGTGITIRGFDPTINDIFASVVKIRPRERFIVACSSSRDVSMSIANIRDLMSIDDGQKLKQVLGELLIYYGDNSTSEQTPHVFPYEFGGETFTYDQIDRCLIPSPRKFWRKCADVTRNFLKENPNVTFHWAEQHGFPKKWREFGFDCADYCTDIPNEARKAIQAVKDAALTRNPYNLMRADLKAVGTGGGTIIEQVAGNQFSKRVQTAGGVGGS